MRGVKAETRLLSANECFNQMYGVWLSTCTFLNADPAFHLLLASYYGLFRKVLASKDKRFSSLQHLPKIIIDTEFWKALAR